MSHFYIQITFEFVWKLETGAKPCAVKVACTNIQGRVNLLLIFSVCITHGMEFATVYQYANPKVSYVRYWQFMVPPIVGAKDDCSTGTKKESSELLFLLIKWEKTWLDNIGKRTYPGDDFCRAGSTEKVVSNPVIEFDKCVKTFPEWAETWDLTQWWMCWGYC